MFVKGRAHLPTNQSKTLDCRSSQTLRQKTSDDFRKYAVWFLGRKFAVDCPLFSFNTVFGEVTTPLHAATGCTQAYQLNKPYVNKLKTLVSNHVKLCSCDVYT